MTKSNYGIFYSFFGSLPTNFGNNAFKTTIGVREICLKYMEYFNCSYLS